MRRFIVAAFAAVCLLASAYGLDDPKAADNGTAGWDREDPTGWDPGDQRQFPSEETLKRLSEEDRRHLNAQSLLYSLCTKQWLPRLANSRLCYLAALADHSFVFTPEMKKQLDDAGMAYLRSDYYYAKIRDLASQLRVQSNTTELAAALCDAIQEFVNATWDVGQILYQLEHQISKPRWDKWQKQFADERAELEKKK